MKISKADVPTESASSYLRKLCQHWSHRFPVEFSDQHGNVQLPKAVCILDATPALLKVRVEIQDDEDQARLEQVVEEHLRCFAFKEELAFAWQQTEL